MELYKTMLRNCCVGSYQPAHLNKHVDPLYCRYIRVLKRKTLNYPLRPHLNENTPTIAESSVIDKKQLYYKSTLRNYFIQNFEKILEQRKLLVTLPPSAP
jgi:hypothetical protein